MMKTRLGILSVLLFTSFAFADEPKTRRSTGDWQSSYAEAETEAREKGLPIVLHFHADWCGPCKNMEANVLSQPTTREFLGSKVIGVKVNSNHQRDLVARFNVSLLPTDIFITHQGVELKRTVGVQDLSTYLQSIQTVSASASIAKSDARKETRKNPPVETNVGLRPKRITPPNSNDDRDLTDTEKMSDTNGLAACELPDGQAKVVLSKEFDDDGYRVGLAGFSPVAQMKERTWKPGLEMLSHEYKGVRYRFVTESELEQFRRNPGAYAPSLHGFDPVAFHDQKNLKIGTFDFVLDHKQKLYFFSSAENLELFRRNPGRYDKLAELQLFRRTSKPNSISMQ